MELPKSIIPIEGNGPIKIIAEKNSSKLKAYKLYVHFNFLTKIPSDWNETILDPFHKFSDTSLTNYISIKCSMLLDGKNKPTSRTIRNFVFTRSFSISTLEWLSFIFFPNLKAFSEFNIEKDGLDQNEFNKRFDELLNTRKATSTKHELPETQPLQKKSAEKSNKKGFRFDGLYNYLTICANRTKIERSWIEVINKKATSGGYDGKIYSGDVDIFRDHFLQINFDTAELEEGYKFYSSYQFKINKPGGERKDFYHGFRIMESAGPDRNYASRVLLIRENIGKFYEDIDIYPAYKSKANGQIVFDEAKLLRYNQLSKSSFMMKKALEFIRTEENNTILGFVKPIGNDGFEREINYGFVFFDTSIKLAIDLEIMGKEDPRYSNRLKKCLKYLDKCSRHFFQGEKYVGIIMNEMKEERTFDDPLMNERVAFRMQKKGVFSNPDIKDRIVINDQKNFFYIRDFFDLELEASDI